MVPKRKSNLTRNPFCSRSSLSSDLPIPPLHVQFRNEKAHQDFSKNFLNVVFIWSAMWFYRTLPTLLYLMSFTLGDENLFVRYPWGVPSCSYRSFTPICTISITKYLSLLWYSEVHVSSHSGSCIRDTTHPAGSTSWLPRLSVSKDYVQRRAFVSLPWDTLYMGWASKSAPCSGFAKGPRFHYLIITPSQSLVLDFFFFIPLRGSFHRLSLSFHYLYHRCL